MPKPKKILDIFSPKPLSFLEGEKFPPKLEIGSEDRKKRKRLPFIIGIIILLGGAGIFSFFLFSKIKIEIWPKTQALNFQTKVQIFPGEKHPDPLLPTIPGKIFETTENISQEFPASGKALKEERAKGQIRVYNAYSTAPQVLIANTRFISAEGKLFRSIKSVTIPGGSYEKRKLIPGYLDIEVIAAEAGEDYNIGPSTFSIPGFVGTAKYTAFYGKSFKPMKGGFRGEVPKVVQEDLDRAKDILVARIFKESKESLKTKISPDFILLDEALVQEVQDSSSSVAAGEIAPSFNFQVEVYSKVLLFKKTDLEKFAKEFLLGKMPQDKKLQEESLKIDFKPESIDIRFSGSEKIILNLVISAKVYSDLKIEELKGIVRGKTIGETQAFLKNHPQIFKAQVTTWPFWLRKVPQNIKRIEIKLNID